MFIRRNSRRGAKSGASEGPSKKGRQPVTDCVVDAEAERAPEDPKIFTRIHFKYRVSGRDLNPAQVERAVKLSKEKYCSATLMLAKSAEITYEVAIDQAGAAGPT